MITKKAEYAISILVELAIREEDGYVPSRYIAASCGVPPNLMGQIVSDLVRAGWVEASRGPSGGIKLCHDPQSLSLKAVIELFDGPMAIKRCLVSDQECAKRTDCKLRGVWMEAQGKMLEVLERVAIADLTSTISRSTPISSAEGSPGMHKPSKSSLP